ncbi:hypothetical protein [Paenibacillus sp. YSY-4.3]
MVLKGRTAWHAWRSNRISAKYGPRLHAESRVIGEVIADEAWVYCQRNPAINGLTTGSY